MTRLVVYRPRYTRRFLRVLTRSMGRLWRTTTGMIPFYGTIRSIIIVIVMLWGYISFWPGEDVPFIPGVACQSTRPATGMVGAAYAAGHAVRSLNGSAPTVPQVQDALMSVAKGAGTAWGAFEAAVKGASQPVEDNPLARHGLPLPAAGCGPCDTTQGIPAGAHPDSKGAQLAADAALAAGWTGDDAVTAVAIAGAESTFNPAAENSSSSARGMWQIMMSLSGWMFHGKDWRDPYANAVVAHTMWEDRGWEPWVTYGGSSYQSYLPAAKVAVDAASNASGTTGTPTAVEASFTPDIINAGTADCSGGSQPAGYPSGSNPVPGADRVIAWARTQIGVPYVYGGTTPDVGLDCSGLTMLAWEQAGVQLPRTADLQYHATQRIQPGQERPGDLIFSEYGSRVAGWGHVRLVISPGHLIAAPYTGVDVRYETYSDSDPGIAFGRVQAGTQG